MSFKRGLNAIGFLLIAIGAFLVIMQPFSTTGAVIDLSTAVSRIWFFIGLGMIGVGWIIFAGNRDLEHSLNVPDYQVQPRLSNELKSRLIANGNYEQFLKDYSNLYHNFMPQKLKIVSKGERYRKRQDLSEEEQRQLKKLGKSYAEALHELLELGILLDKDKKEYAIIGGFGVLGNMMRHNPKFVSKFRGTEDIDILSNEGLSGYYRRGGFEKIPTERIDLSTIPDKRLDTYIKRNPNTDSPIKIQERRTIAFGRTDATSTVLKNKVKVNFYGIPIWVADPDSLINSKITGRTRKDKLGSFKDLVDQRQLDLIKQYEDKVNKARE
jgi:hypothetical protein